MTNLPKGYTMPFYKCTVCEQIDQRLHKDDLPGVAPLWWGDCQACGHGGVMEYHSESPTIRLKKGDTGDGSAL